MSYDAETIARTFELISERTASPQAYADLEHYLIAELTARGADATIQMLQGLPKVKFASVEAGVSSPFSKLVAKFGDRRIVVSIFESDDMVSVDIALEPDSQPEVVTDARHDWFYSSWENLLHISADSEVRRLGDAERSVYFVALLEAEVMNGGLGQYLTNTEGEFVDETIACLNSVGAATTGKILAKAKRLKGSRESYPEIWETKAKGLEQLDDEFMAGEDDLAGLVADKFRE